MKWQKQKESALKMKMESMTREIVDSISLPEIPEYGLCRL